MNKLKRKQKLLENNQNGNKTMQNLWDAAKAVVKWKFIVLQTSLKKQEKS